MDHKEVQRSLQTRQGPTLIHHGNKSHIHILLAPDDEGPHPFKEDIHASSLQIMINPNAKDKLNKLLHRRIAH
jgi:hypothetical protein